MPSLNKLSFLLFYPLFSTGGHAIVHNSELELRITNFDREFSNSDRDRRQTGSGVIFRHKFATEQEKLSFTLGAYSAQNWSSSGDPREDVFTAGADKVRSFSLIGEAILEFKANDSLSLEVGRFQQKSLLLKSKQRALPSTFEGVKFSWRRSKKLNIYGSLLRKWSRRANDSFQHFSTELDSNNEIDWLLNAGVNYELDSSHIQIEYLESKDFIRKAGLVLEIPLWTHDRWKIQGEFGAFISRDAGSLFIGGANSALDLNPDTTIGRLKHRGFGHYQRVFLSYGAHRLEVAHSGFNEPWLEDSFADDHGTTPFPTRTFGPELTNSNEDVWLIGYRHKFVTPVLKGLSLNFRYAKGHNAENSVSPSFGLANEEWRSIDIKYKPPKLDNLNARLIYRDYQSDVNGEVAGIKSDRHETRFFIDYEFRF